MAFPAKALVAARQLQLRVAFSSDGRHLVVGYGSGDVSEPGQEVFVSGGDQRAGGPHLSQLCMCVSGLQPRREPPCRRFDLRIRLRTTVSCAWTYSDVMTGQGSLVGRDQSPPRARGQAGVQPLQPAPCGRSLVGGGLGDLMDAPKVWDATTGEEVQPGADWVAEWSCSHVHYDQYKLKSASEKFDDILDFTVRKLRDNNDGKEIILRGDTKIEQVAVSSDGKLIAFVEEDGTNQILDAMNGKVVRNVRHHTDNVGFHSLAFSPDGKRLAVAAGEVTVWTRPLARR